MDGVELARQIAAELHACLVASGADPWLPYDFAVAEAKRRGIDVEPTAVGAAVLNGGRATFVVGNSCLRGCDLNNALGLRTAAGTWGLRLEEHVERALPNSSRYLPITGRDLSKRMRTEAVLTFLS